MDYPFEVSVLGLLSTCVFWEDLENPEIMFWGGLREGRPVNITCTAPGSCSLKPPHVFWKETPSKVTPRSSEMQSNDSQVYISMLDFMPSRTDHGKELTCSVIYGGGASPVSKERTIRLNIRYPPLIKQIGAEVTGGNGSLKNYTVSSQIVVEKGDSVVLRCMAEGNPPPKVTWAKESVNLTTDNELKLSSVKMQAMGEYKCHAQNSEGSSTKSFQLSIASESTWSQSTVNAVVAVLVGFAVVMLIIAVILISKKCQRKSMTDLESHKKLRTPHNEISSSGQGFNTINLNKEGDNYVPKEPEKAEESADIVSNDPEELHYASITFTVPNQMPEPNSEEPQTEYAEIKR